jgi:hypothetical protein
MRGALSLLTHTSSAKFKRVYGRYYRPLKLSTITDKRISMGHCWNDSYGAKTKYWEEKPVPLPISTPQIPHGMALDCTRASKVPGRGRTARLFTARYAI